MPRAEPGGAASPYDRPDMKPAVAITHAGRRVMLKWHKLRRSAGEPPFDPDSLRTGLAAGASMEIDVRCLGDGCWVCLHDDHLDSETDGAGPVAALDRTAAAGLRIAGAGYAPPLLGDLARIVVEAGPTAAWLQLDLKEPAETLTDGRIASLADAIAGIAPLCVLSGYDWPTLARVGAAIPGLRLGYDPYEVANTRALHGAADYERFTRETLETTPSAAIFYLYHRFVAAALDHGVNPIAILKAGGASVDVWTLDPKMPDFLAVLTRMVAAGADQITTNDPEAVARIWAARTE